MADRKHHIVSLLPSATEIVWGLGLRDQLVGISHECNWPADVHGLPRVTRSNVDSSATSSQIDQQVTALMQSGKALYEVDESLLVSLQPDLIITQAQCEVCAVSYDALKHFVSSTECLRRTPIVASNPSSLTDVLDDIESIAKAAGVLSAGRVYRRNLQQRIDAIAQRTSQFTQRPRTVVIEWTEPLMVAGNWTPGMVELAGGDYGLASPGEHSRYISWQEMLEYQPDVVVVAPCGFDLARSKAELATLRLLPEWQELSVTAEHVYAVDGDAFFNRPGPRLVDSVEMLSRWIHSSCVTAPKRD